MIVYRPPFDVAEALGRGDTVRVPMKGRTVRECRDLDALFQWGEWGECRYKNCPGDSNVYQHETRERLVAPIQPATPCPDCIDGRKMVDGYGYPFPCPTCNGTRWVGGDLGLVTEHGRLIHDGEATSWKPIGSKPLCPHVERRLVVPWRTQVTELWPVIGVPRPGAWKDVEPPSRYVVVGDDVWACERQSAPNRVSDEPWAQHLEPGMFVATLEGLWPIDPPIVDMPCAECRRFRESGETLIGRTCMAFGCMNGFLPSGRVPLSVDPGEAVTL